MTLKEILKEAETVFKSKWEERKGQKVPDTDNIQLGNEAVTLDGTVLYADMVDSTTLVNTFSPWFAAEIYKTYLVGACRIIRNNGGEITAFDGDRVMAVFIGGYKNSSAAKTALQIYGFVVELNAAITKSYPKSNFVLRHTVGIDTSKLFVARTGIRNANDLVWVGRAANYAAKLCALGTADFPSHITKDVYVMLHKDSKISQDASRNMWEERFWVEKNMTVYRSGWWWKF